MKPNYKKILKPNSTNGFNIQKRTPNNQAPTNITKHQPTKNEVAKEKQRHQHIQREAEKSTKAKDELIQEYKKKRLQKTKALCKKTNRGQPLMKDRMELLLKEIQEIKRR